jgi:hypothetical protein
MVQSNQKADFQYKIWSWATFILGLTLIVLVPPFHSPDEFNHFSTAKYYLATYALILLVLSGGLSNWNQLAQKKYLLRLH